MFILQCYVIVYLQDIAQQDYLCKGSLLSSNIGSAKWLINFAHFQSILETSIDYGSIYLAS